MSLYISSNSNYTLDEQVSPLFELEDLEKQKSIFQQQKQSFQEIQSGNCQITSELISDNIIQNIQNELSINIDYDQVNFIYNKNQSNSQIIKAKSQKNESLNQIFSSEKSKSLYKKQFQKKLTRIPICNSFKQKYQNKQEQQEIQLTNQQLQYQQIQKNNQKLYQNDFEKKFELGPIIGEGVFTIVRKCYLKSNPQQKFAVKIIRDDDQEKLDLARKEFALLKDLPYQQNIVQVYDLIEDKNRNTLYMVMELIEGQTLEQYIEASGTMKEEQAKLIIKQLLEAIQFLNSNYICHRDIKNDNIIILNKNQNFIKIIDFNISQKLDNKNKNFEMTQRVGVPIWCAPEMNNNGYYNQKVDIWSIGCILFYLLIGQTPFERSLSYEELIFKQKQNYFMQQIQDKISNNAFKVLTSLLQYDFSLRQNAYQLLELKWFNSSIQEIIYNKNLNELQRTERCFNYAQEIYLNQQFSDSNKK